MLSWYRGFVSFDAMFSLIPILLLTVFLLNIMHYLLYDAVESVEAQEKFNKLVLVADYIVKRGGAYEKDNIIYPNLIDPGKLKGLETELGSKISMDLFIGLESEGGIPNTDKECIYRIVVNNNTGEIDRLFVCG